MVKSTDRKQRLDTERLAKRVVSAGGAVTAKGLAAGRVLRRTAELEDALFELGHLFLVLDPHSADPAQQTFDALLRSYEVAVDRRMGLSDEALRLVEGLHARRSGGDSLLPTRASRAVRLETIGRLWTALSKQMPAVLFVASTDALPSDDRTVVDFLTNNVFSDPIERLSPETSAWDVANGAVLFAPESPAWLPSGSTLLDYETETEDAVRSLLETDEVVRQFARASGGDVDELARLVDRLPESTTPLRLLSAQRLPTDTRTVLELAAVAGSPVPPDLIARAYETIFDASFYSSALRELCSDGFLKRTMGAGSVLVHADDQGLAEALRSELDDDVLTAMHSAIADSAITNKMDEPAFIADHLLASGRGDESAQWAFVAGRRALDRDAVEDAIVRFQQVVDYARDVDVRCEAMSELVDAYASAGQIERALTTCDELADLLEGAEAKLALKVRMANLLSRFGSRNEAIELYDEALASDDLAQAVRYDAIIGKGDAHYASAEYDKARKLAEEHLVELEERCRTTNERTLHASALRLRNLLGKIAIFQGRLDDAESIFERNAAEAKRWSWDDEVSRAHGNLGIVAMQRGDDETSLQRLVAALETVGATGGLPRAYCLINLATVFQKSDRYDEALEHCLEGLRCAKRISDKLAYRSAANNLASIYHDLGAFDRAWSIFEHLESVGGAELDLFSQKLSSLAKANLLLAQQQAEKSIADFERLTDDDVPAFVSNQARARLTEAHVDLEQWDVVRDRLENADRATGWENHWLAYEAALDLADENYEAVVEKTAEALESLPKRAAVRARLLRARALEAMGREKEARQVLDEGVRSVSAALSRVPDAFHEIYAMKPEHVELFQAARDAGAALPERIRRWLDTEIDAETETDQAAFTSWRRRYSDIVGEDPRLHQIFRMVDRVASSDATVLIHGESGTGKELVASAMHEQSDRNDQPFIKVNCAAFVENLLLSELFGHEKGAFTGAVSQKEGRFARADGGTIFLDEIGDISPNTQVALLRVLQEGTFERVGGSETQKVDVRVVCATNKNLEELVERGEFRLDLYYRLKGVVLEMPALRERRADIPRLARHFAASFAAPGRQTGFAPDVMQFLASYSWPGNVRELQNFVKSILLFAEDDYVTMEQIDEFREFFSSGTIDPSLPPIELHAESVEFDVDLDSWQEEEGELYADPEEALVEQLVAAGGSLSDLKKRLEIECIKRALIETEGNVTRAAEILQMKRPRLSQIINGTDELAELKQQLVS